MAIWQFRMIFLPKDLVITRHGNPPLLLRQEVAEQFPWWSEIQPPPGIESRIGLLLPEVRSWSENMRQWGDEDRNNAYVCYKSERLEHVEEIGFRLDVRDLKHSALQAICILADESNCVVMTSNYLVLPPNESMICGAIATSPATKYLRDPEQTLLALDQDKFQYIVDLVKRRTSPEEKKGPA